MSWPDPREDGEPGCASLLGFTFSRREPQGVLLGPRAGGTTVRFGDG